MSHPRPPDLLCAEDFEQRAREVLPAAVVAWLEGGSGSESALRANRAAFARWTICPRAFRRSNAGHLRLSLFGQMLQLPILLAPVGQLGRCHPDAERAVALAAEAAGTALVLSSYSSLPMQAVTEVLGPRAWFQLYWQSDRTRTLALLRRAEQAGVGAIVLTVDTPVQPLSRAAQRAGAAALPFSCPNLIDLPPAPTRLLESGDHLVFQAAMAEAPHWQDIEWLRAQTSLPLIAKGILHPDDAARWMDLGGEGVIVSNHGGRSLDSAPAALDQLPAIRSRLGPDATILLDGGVREGSDVFKAIALGANAVLIGRAQAQALAVAGAAGVAHLLRLLADELACTMALAGRFQICEINASDLARAP